MWPRARAPACGVRPGPRRLLGASFSSGSRYLPVGVQHANTKGEPTLSDPILFLLPERRQFTEVELQILAMARALAPELMPAVAALSALHRSGAIMEKCDVYRDIGESKDQRHLPPNDFREASWLQIIRFALLIAEYGRGIPLAVPQPVARCWSEAYLGVSPADPVPAPLTQIEAQKLLAFTDAAFAYLLSCPIPSVREWAVLNAGQLRGNCSLPEIGPPTAV